MSNADYSNFAQFIKCVAGAYARNICEIQYFMSMGIALPFMGYTVEELEKLGWIKLIK